MFCPKCGFQNGDSVAFCQQCGTPMTPPAQPVQQIPPQQPYAQSAQPAYTEPTYAQPVQPTYAPPAQPAYTQPVYTQPAYNQGYTPAPAPQAQELTPAQKAIKSMAGSPFFLVTIILFSAGLLFQLFQSSSSFAGLYSLFNQLGIGYEMNSVLNEVLGIFGGSVFFLTLILMLPDILTAVGLWLSFGTSKSKTNNMSSAGLTMIKIVSIIKMVFYAIGLVFLFVTLITAALITEDPGAIIVVFMLEGGIGFLFIFYYIKLLKTLGAGISTCQIGKPFKNISLFLAIWSFIWAAGDLIWTTLNTMVWSIIAFDALGFILDLLRIGTTICFGIVILQYRNKISTVPSHKITYNY